MIDPIGGQRGIAGQIGAVDQHGLYLVDTFATWPAIIVANGDDLVQPARQLGQPLSLLDGWVTVKVMGEKIVRLAAHGNLGLDDRHLVARTGGVWIA